MKITDEMLMAYADGELDAQQRVEVEAAMALDPKLAGRVEQHQALRGTLRAAYDPALKEPVPERLLGVLNGTRAAPRSAQVLQFRPRPAAPGTAPVVRMRKPWMRWSGIAASLVLGMIAGLVAGNFGDRDAWVSGENGSLVARGALAEALSTQLASNQPSDAEIRMNVSFKDRGGAYCRAFNSSGSQNLAGIACRAGDNWQLQILESAPATAADGTYRQASSSLPVPVLQQVKTQIAGDALDASAEKAAQKAGWH